MREAAMSPSHRAGYPPPRMQPPPRGRGKKIPRRLLCPPHSELTKGLLRDVVGAEHSRGCRPGFFVPEVRTCHSFKHLGLTFFRPEQTQGTWEEQVNLLSLPPNRMTKIYHSYFHGSPLCSLNKQHTQASPSSVHSESIS